MTSPIPQQDIDWLQEQVAPYAQAPYAMLRGGSRGGATGTIPMTSSDNDVVVIAEDIAMGYSITRASPHTKAHYDIIIRDPDTLAYDVETARNGGNGTLLHITAYSEIVADDNGLGAVLQRNAQCLYMQGPHPVSRESFELELATGLQDLAHLERQKDEECRLLATLSLSHRFARLAVRGSCNWIANGKVLDRFLQTHHAGFRAELSDATDNALAGNLAPFHEIAKDGLIQLHFNGSNAVPYQQKFEHPDTPTVAQVYHFGRLSGHALRDYLWSRQPETKAVAKDWLRYKHDLTSHAVEAERFDKKPGEYRFALGRYVGQLMEMAALEQKHVPQHLDLGERALLLKMRAPQITAALPVALAGKPEALHAAAQQMVEQVAGPAQEFRPRPSLRSNRASAQQIGLL